MSDDILDNYRDLIATTGESAESVAARIDAANDPALAARIRAELAPKAEPKRSATTGGKRTATND